MSMTALAWALDQPIEPLATKCVLIILADKANGDGACWLSMDYLCKVTRLSERQVRRHIETLAAAGYLQTENRGRLANGYRLELTGHGCPVNGGHKRPVNEMENRTSMSPDSERLTGHPRQENRTSMTDTSLLIPKIPKKKTFPRTPTDAHEEIPDTPAWLKRLSLPAWQSLSINQIAQLETQANRLGVNISDEAMACDDWMKNNRRTVKAPYSTLKNWLDKASKIKEERNGDSRKNSHSNDSRPAADDTGRDYSGWKRAIETRGRSVGAG